MTYLLRITSAHARAIAVALDIYHRAAMGQWRIVVEHFEGKNGDWQQQRNQGLEQAADQLQRILCPDLSPSGGYGYGSERTGKTGQLVYEVMKSLRHRIAWTEQPVTKSEMCSNDHFVPLLFPSNVSPRPECAAEDGKQPEIEYNGTHMHVHLAELLGTSDVVESLRIIRRWKEAAASVGVV